jgi:hypothetical protein
VYYRGIRDFESLEGADLVGFATLMHQLFRLYEEAYSGHLEGPADLRLWRGWETARATSADILEFRLGGVHARIGSMRSSRSSLISYSRQPSLQGCIANQWKMNELSDRRLQGYCSLCTFTKSARAKINAASISFPMLPFGRLLYGEPNAVSNAIGYAQRYSRSHDAVIRVYDESCNVIETHDQKVNFKEP